MFNFACLPRQPVQTVTVNMLGDRFYGHRRKTLIEDMICFQQAACQYLQLYKEKNMHTPWKNQQMNAEGDSSMLQPEERLHKYLDRMYFIVQCRSNKYKTLSEDDIFKELNKVVQCQCGMKENDNTIELEKAINNTKGPFLHDDMHVLTGIPLVDIILNIDWFTAHFDDRKKVLRILKDLFNHCNSFKKLLLQHNQLILPVLLSKYDK